MKNILTGLLLLLLLPGKGYSQDGGELASYKIRDGRMYITVDKRLSAAGLSEFISRYDLKDLSLDGAMRGGGFGKLTHEGWRIDLNNPKKLVISKAIGGVDELEDPAKRLALTEPHPNTIDLFPPQNDDLVYGFNRFTGKYPFAVRDSMVTIFLKGHTHAGEVLLAASFTGWQLGALPMTRTDSGWIRVVRLGPGKYWYKFIIDGDWTVDRDNDLQEADPNGNENSVFYVSNIILRFPGHPNAGRVFLSGDFNDWGAHDLPMDKTPTGWAIHLYLADGTYVYKFLADGVSYPDPAHSEGDRRSVLRIGRPHVFFLKGYGGAHQVALTGSFNHWKSDDLLMHKTDSGWRLPFTLGAGNYPYRFVVDGHSIRDPNNPLFITHNGATNSFLVVGPNYTFRLHGYWNARQVFLAGDFNDWTSDGLPMKREGDDWVFTIHLSYGKHLYKFIVDGNWIKDPGNPLWEENEYNTDNSVIWMEDR